MVGQATPRTTHLAVESTSAGSSSDSALLERVRGGDHAAMDALVNAYWGRIQRYSLKIVGDADAAEDIAQETFFRFWVRRERWRPRGSIRALLYRIARNLSLNYRASRDTRRRLRRRLWHSAQESPPRPDQLLEANEIRDAVRAAIGELSERRREVLELVHFHGLSYREVAETLEIAPQTVANHVSAALASLRSSLRPVLDPPSPRARRAGPSLRLT